MKNNRFRWVLLTLLISLTGCQQLQPQAIDTDSPRTLAAATGDLGIIIERATGSVLIVNNSTNNQLARVTGLGDLSHASAVFSRDQRFAYVFGRDGGLTKVDITQGKIVHRIIQSGNSIGGAISQDGRYIAVSNYTPGGVNIFDADTLRLIQHIPATELPHHPRNDDGSLKRSKVVGLVDAPDHQFVFSLFDSDEIWVAKVHDDAVSLTKFNHIGRNPYDALITPEGRYYIAGLFGEDGMALLDLWHIEKGVQRILPHYGKGEQKLPVYKMPHLEGWTIAGNLAFVPAVGEHHVLVVDTTTWQLVNKIPVHGQPVFVMSQPDHRKIWVNFAFPLNDTVQIIDVEQQQVQTTLTPGPGVLHLEFTPRGEQVWLSVRDKNTVNIYDTYQQKLVKQLQAESPSGIFFTHRAGKIGL
jgi:protein NirF